MTVQTRAGSKSQKTGVNMTEVASEAVNKETITESETSDYDKKFAENLYQNSSQNVKDIVMKILHTLKFDSSSSQEVKRLVDKVLLYIYLENDKFDVRKLECFTNVDHVEKRDFDTLLDLAETNYKEPYEFFTCPPEKIDDKEVEDIFYCLLDIMTQQVFGQLQFYKCNPKMFKKYMAKYALSSNESNIQNQVTKIFLNFARLEKMPCKKTPIQNPEKSLKLNLKLSNKKFKSN